MAKQLTAHNSLPHASGDQNRADHAAVGCTTPPPTPALPPALPAPETTTTPPPKRSLYFINEVVEDSLRLYIWTGCTRVKLRDRIMNHATELIRQIIRKQGLHTIYPGQEDSSFNDLLQTAWCQLERTLYKFRARPHCRTCYNPDRPTDSLLYNPGELEYGIITYAELFKKGIVRCQRCQAKLAAEPTIVAEQDCYGGSATVLYRGPSKVFNMWCVAPGTHLLGCCGVTTIDETIAAFTAGYNVHTHGLDGIKPIQAAKLRPESATVVVETMLGYRVECSPEHQLLSLGDDGPVMREVKDLQVGDLLGVQYNQQIFGGDDSLLDVTLSKGGQWAVPPTMTPELANLIGLFIAEGSYSYGKLVIYNIDTDVVERLVNNTLGLNFVHEEKYQRVSLCNVRFIEFLIALGFPAHTTAAAKFIPARLLKLSRSNTLALLSGLFDGDGHSSRHNGSVGYSTTSPLLRDQIRMLLLNLGIITKLSRDPRTKRRFRTAAGRVYESDLSGGWQVSLSSANSAKFYDLVGFGIGRKQQKAAALSQRHLFYGLNAAFRHLYTSHGCGHYGYDKIRHLLRSVCCTLNTARFALDNWSAYTTDSAYRFIVARVDELTRPTDNVVWLPVRSLIPSRSELCEISVDSETHTYIANGIISHNSQIARTVILAHIKKEGRDRKNSGTYRTHIDNRPKPMSDVMIRFLAEARLICKYNDDHLKVLDTLENLLKTDEKPYDGVIGKLVEQSGLSRIVVTSFMKIIRLRSFEFSDSPINRGQEVSRRRYRLSGDNHDEHD